MRVVELGCGLGLPSIVASRLGATVVATDAYAEPLALLAHNAGCNGVAIETVAVDWAEPERWSSAARTTSCWPPTSSTRPAGVHLRSCCPTRAQGLDRDSRSRPAAAFMEHAGGWLHEIRNRA